MKRILFISIFTFIGFYSFSQTGEFIVYNNYNLFEESNKTDSAKTVSINRKKEIGKVWSIALDFGYGFRMAPLSKEIKGDLRSYKKDLKHGANIGLYSHYFLSKHFGLGCRYSLFNTKNSENDLSYTYMGSEYRFAHRSDNIYIHYFGPSVSLRTSGSKKVYTNFDFSLGYMKYANYVELNDKEYNLDKGNFSFMTTISTDFMVSNNMSLGVNLNILAASIKADNVVHLENENFSRLSLGMVIKYLR